MQTNREPRRPRPTAFTRRVGLAASAVLVVLGGTAVTSTGTDGPTGTDGLAPLAAPTALTQVAAVTPLPAQVRILPLGDSLTYGIGSSTSTGYRTDLLARLTAAGVDADLVGSRRNGRGPDLDHEGHPGWRIDQISAQIDTWMVDSRPDLVLLDIGTNDYVWNHDTETTAARLSDLLDRILMFSPTVRVVVAKLLVPMGAARARGISAFNAAVPAVAASKGPRVSVVDMSRISNRNTVEGLHPNDLGYRQMSYQWFQALRPVLGGRSWPVTDDPFPAPAVRLTRSTAVAPAGGTVTLTAQLAGALTTVDLGRVPVQLVYRRLGSDALTVLQTARTAPDGRVVFRQKLNRAGVFTARVTGGRAAGRQSAAVRIDATS